MISMRRAVEGDRRDIAYCIAEAFSKDFELLCKETQVVSEALEEGIQIERFYVALSEEDEVIGSLGIGDCRGRSILTTPKRYRKKFGLIKGMLEANVLKEEFEKALEYPETVGYIECVCVRKAFKRQGITTNLLKYAIDESPYLQYELDVTNINEAANKCYEKFGFKPYKKEMVKYAKQKGFEYKIFMRYE